MEACKIAYFKPAETVESLISELRSSLAIASTVKHAVAVDAHFVDRKYWGEWGRSQIRKGFFCILFNNKGCWSKIYSIKKRLAALRRNENVRQFVASLTEDDKQVESSIHRDDDDGADDQHVDELKDLSGIAYAVCLVTYGEEDPKEQTFCVLATANKSDDATAYITWACDAITSHALNGTRDNDSRYKDKFYVRHDDKHRMRASE